MANRITVHQGGTPIYDIVLESSFDRLSEEAGALGVKAQKLCIVSDSNVAPLYLAKVKAQLQSCCRQIDSFIFPAGEEQKTLNTVRDLYETLILQHYDRGDMLVALGGGVVGDLCGYAAATYLRGIRFIQIPTTLLSQVDSSIGGKTGVDFDAYKNMVGAFHMPRLVYTNTAALLSLSDEQYASGMGEIIKHGLIKDADYYQWLKAHRTAIQARDLAVCEEMIIVSSQIKRRVVEQDPTEQGERALLNFGHTLGHSIEKLMNFQLLHGHCVALGALAAAYLSACRGGITMKVVADLEETFHSFQLPVSISGMNLDSKEVVAVTKNDKKMNAGTIKFILLSAVGTAYVDRTVTDAELSAAVTWLQGGAHER